MAVLTVQGSQFILDGEPIQILSGAIHYFRVVPEYWKDRLLEAEGLRIQHGGDLCAMEYA